MRMNISYKRNYTSCGCNKIPHCVDWSNDGLLCFASYDTISIADTSVCGTSKIVDKLLHHKGRVNSVRWLRTKKGTTVDAFVSASADKTGALWSRDGDSFNVEFSMKEHSDAVTIIDGILNHDDNVYMRNKSETIIASASVDSNIKIWQRHGPSDLLAVHDTINLGSGIALDIKLASLAETPLIICATDDNKVHIFWRQANNQFIKVHVIIGHEDWVRALDICYVGINSFYLGTASQDSYVRVYNFQVKEKERKTPSNGIETEEIIFEANGTKVSVCLETVLAGHEGWIYGLSWNYKIKDDDLKLLTASMDRSLVIWTPQDGLWQEKARVGEVGGNSLGFYGGKFGKGGQDILAHGYQGSFHHWKNIQGDSWEPQVVVSGHVGDVVDIGWAPNGRYLLSCATDQTARLHAPWKQSMWHEIARPQIHGLDMSCLAVVSSTMFVSGAEEKMLRVFTAPRNFLENFERMCGIKAIDEIEFSDLPEGAAVPALGLSNKPVYQGTTEADAEQEAYFTPLHLDCPPTEENLLQNTLWPEIQKLYGHANEISCVVARPDGGVIASACNASQMNLAAVYIWDTTTWKVKQKLPWHQLTVTQMAFSPNGNYLVTVSRDRKWCLYKFDESSSSYVLSETGIKTPHTRVIWCCAWTEDGSAFATGSREGQICVWSPENGSLINAIKEENGDSITALAFSKSSADEPVILVAGTESGCLLFYLFQNNTLSLLLKKQEHSCTVRRILFRPEHNMQFATCSKDYSVTIFNILF